MSSNRKTEPWYRWKDDKMEFLCQYCDTFKPGVRFKRMYGTKCTCWHCWKLLERGQESDY